MTAARRMLRSAPSAVPSVCAPLALASLLLVVLSVRPVAAQTEVIEYYGQDALGSVRIVFNADGVATARADFEPFGELFTVPVMPGGQLPAQQFTGQERDPEASQDYFGALDNLWLRGGFPRAFLARTNADSLAWREGFIRTFLERDLPQLGITISPVAMRRFWTMVAHYHAQTWNGSELARAMGLSDKSVRGYLDILTGAFVLRQLQPWHENIGKRQVKAPKIYVRDAGLLHALLSIPDRSALLGHPKVGASWEGFVIEQVLQAVLPADAYFWATHNGAELDLFLMHRGRRVGIECRFAEAPTVTRSMRIALDDLRLDHLWVVHPGRQTYRMDDRLTACALVDLDRLVRDVGGGRRQRGARVRR